LTFFVRLATKLFRYLSFNKVKKVKAVFFILLPVIFFVTTFLFTSCKKDIIIEYTSRTDSVTIRINQSLDYQSADTYRGNSSCTFERQARNASISELIRKNLSFGYFSFNYKYTPTVGFTGVDTVVFRKEISYSDNGPIYTIKTDTLKIFVTP
jgi:hypothetical protein